MVLGVLVGDASKAKEIKTQLEAFGLLHRSVKISKSEGKLFIPFADEAFNGTLAEDSVVEVQNIDSRLRSLCQKYPIRNIPIEPSKSPSILQKLTDSLPKDLPNLHLYLPSSWELYENLLILPESFPTNPPPIVIEKMQQVFQVKVIGQKQRISQNEIRSPQLRFFAPAVPTDNFYTSIKQNGIIYTWSPTHTMFCAGNISEKQRVARFPALGETILDLYVGIGYFSLPLLVHAGAKRVIACDLNPHSIEALTRNVKLNGISPDRIEILCGNNAEFVPHYKGKCDRVMLGLIPTSRQGWQLAVQALKPAGGILHVHENVKKGLEAEHSALLVQEFSKLDPKANAKVMHIEKVKSYAPKINHLVFDICIKR